MEPRYHKKLRGRAQEEKAKSEHGDFLMHIEGMILVRTIKLKTESV